LPSRQPSQLRMMYTYRPECRRCGSLTFLASIRPSNDEGHDLRAFECENCGEKEVVKIRFKG
jgi:hypothetical protein